MACELKDAISAHSIVKNSEKILPFQNHPQLMQIADTFYRLHQHNVILNSNASALITQYYCDTLANHLIQSPRGLKNVEFYNVNLIDENKENETYIHAKISDLIQVAQKKNKTLIFIFHKYIFTSTYLNFLSTHPNARLLILNSTMTHNDFVAFNIDDISQHDAFLILQNESERLSTHHNVIMADDVIESAYHLSQKFLGNNNHLENTLALLDSSAARLYNPNVDKIKPVINLNDITEVLSDWINIPVEYISLGKIKPQDIVQNLQAKVFGQEAAISLLAQELHQANISLNNDNPTFSNLLLAGAKHSGKKTLTLALAECLYQRTHMIYCLQNSAAIQGNLAEVKFQSLESKHHIPLKIILQKKPYAILLIEDIEQLPTPLLEELQEILSSGYIRDNLNIEYCLKNIIFVLTTTLGTTRLLEISKKQNSIEEKEDIDLVKLVMNEEPEELTRQAKLSPQQLTEEVAKEIASYIPAAILQHLFLVPFFPPDKAVIENIIRLKLKNLGKQLLKDYAIELGYAPEVIRYLSNNMTKKHNVSYIDKIIKSLSSIVEQAIVTKDPTRAEMNQLLLQLNESGQMIRADWMSKEARHTA